MRKNGAMMMLEMCMPMCMCMRERAVFSDTLLLQ